MSTHDARGPVISRQLADREWRVGGSVGRTIYAVEGRNDPSDFLIGMMDSADLARLVVDDHNTMHAARQGTHIDGGDHGGSMEK